MAVFNMSKFNLEGSDFFCDQRLDKINIYSVVLSSNSVDFELIITQFLLMMSSLSLVQMIQETADDYARFTFVSGVNCTTFSKCLNTNVNSLCSLYKCKIVVL